MELGLIMLRFIVGGLLVGHGAQKLFGSFGGYGLGGTAAFFERIGLRPGRTHATAAGGAEFAAGLLLILGLLTPVAALLVIAVMVAAIITVHWPNGVWATGNGYEYNVVLAAVAFALAATGPGEWSLDAALGLELEGAAWALIALGGGILGGFGAVVSGRRVPQDRGSTVGHAH